MPKVKYDANGSDADDVSVFGYDFSDGKATEVKDEDVSKFAGNPFFKVAAEKAEKSVTPAATGLKAVHIAGGRFVIKDGDKVVKEGLNKSDADAFNAMSDEDKAEYVKD